MKRLSTRSRLLLLALLLAAWAWRLHGLDAQSLWRDEVDSLIFATRPLAQVLGNFTRPGENGPLYFLILRPWLAGAGHSEYALRFPSVLGGLSALPLLFLWGKRLFGRRSGLAAVLLLAANPYHVWYSQEAKMYALLVALVLLTLWALARALECGGVGRWLLWLALVSAAIYVHVLTVLLVPLQVAWVLLVPRWRSRWRGFALALAALIAPYIPLLWWQWALLSDPDFSTGHAFTPLGRMLLNLFAAQIQGVGQRPPSWFFTPAIFLLLSALVLARGRARSRQITLSWWFLPPLAVFALSLFTSLFTDRYLIWTLPALVLLLALGLSAVAMHSRFLAGSLLVALLALQLWAGWRQSTQPIKSDFRAAAAYISDRRQEDDLMLFLIPYIRATYRYYDPGPYAWAEAPYANRTPDDELVPGRLQTITAGHDGVWLVESEGEFYDRKGLIQGWLRSHGRLDEQAHFTRVNVYHYDLR